MARGRSLAIAGVGSGLVVLVATLVYAIGLGSRLGVVSGEDSWGTRAVPLLLWLFGAIAIGAFATYAIVRGRRTWVWAAGACAFLQLLVLLSMGRGLWTMFVGEGLVLPAAVLFEVERGARER